MEWVKETIGWCTSKVFLPSATKLWQRNVLHLSVILFIGRGCLPQCMLGYTPWRDTPWRDTPWADTPRTDTHLPPGQTSPWADTDQADTPLPADGYCSGRYASYWNAFLFENIVLLTQSQIVTNIQTFNDVTIRYLSKTDLLNNRLLSKRAW